MVLMMMISMHVTGTTAWWLEARDEMVLATFEAIFVWESILGRNKPIEEMWENDLEA